MKLSRRQKRDIFQASELLSHSTNWSDIDCANPRAPCASCQLVHQLTKQQCACIGEAKKSIFHINQCALQQTNESVNYNYQLSGHRHRQARLHTLDFLIKSISFHVNFSRLKINATHETFKTRTQNNKLLSINPAHSASICSEDFAITKYVQCDLLMCDEMFKLFLFEVAILGCNVQCSI